MTATCTASRADQTGGAEHHLTRPVDGVERHGADLIHDPEQRLEGGLNRVAPLDGDIPMQDLLQDLGVGHQPMPLDHQTLELTHRHSARVIPSRLARRR